MDRTRRPAAGGAAAGVVAVAGALVLVVLASRGMPGEETTTAAYTASMSDRLLLALFVVAVVAATGLVIWSSWPDGAQRPEHERQSWWKRYATSLAVMLLFVLMGAIWQEVGMGDDGRSLGRRREMVERPQPTDADSDDQADRGGWRPASGTATAMLGTVALAVAAVVIGRRLAKRRAEDLARQRATEGGPSHADGRPHDPHAPDVLPDGYDEADLAAEPDARLAVRLAYALLERRLASTPAARPIEATPQEWLAVLRRHAPDEADDARTLTALYEQARFAGDQRPTTDDDRHQAIQGLQRLSGALLQPSTSSRGRDSTS